MKEKSLTPQASLVLRNGTAGKRGSSLFTSLIGGTSPLKRYSLKTKPVKHLT